MIVRDPRSTWRYVLKVEQSEPVDKQTVWQFKHLTLAEESALLDGLALGQHGSTRLAILRGHLTGWENLKDANGVDVQFDCDVRTKLVKDELLLKIPLWARQELAIAIENESVFEPDELGKSAPPSI